MSIKTNILTALLLIMFGWNTTYAYVVFTDVPGNHWAYKTIMDVTADPIGQTIMKGHPDQTFDPDGELNRAEMAKIATELHTHFTTDTPTKETQTATFKDVAENSWYHPYVQETHQLGIIHGYADTTGAPTHTYGPADPLTIAQALKIYIETLKLDLMPYKEFMYKDVDTTAWYAPYIETALYYGMLTKEQNIKGNFTATLFPNRNISRAETITLLQQAMRIAQDESITSYRTGRTKSHKDDTYIYYPAHRPFSLKFPKRFGKAKQIADSPLSTLDKLPGSEFIFTTSNEVKDTYLYKTPELDDYLDIVLAINNNEFTASLQDKIILSWYLFTAYPKRTIAFTFTDVPKGFEEIIVTQTPPRLQDYYLQKVMIKGNDTIHFRLPLFPTNMDGYLAIEKKFQDIQKNNSNYLSQFHTLLPNLMTQKEAELAPFSKSDIESLQERIRIYIAMTKVIKSFD